jgi:hypothetical protein
MALISPGVEVTVIDESFYTPAEPGTTPLIVIATGENKKNAAGTGTAAGTLAANIGKAFRITSQRELVETYGVPFFEKTPNSSPVHGGERNEYGLLAAYSYLGVSNSAFIVRADVDLNELAPQTAAPGAEPLDGAWWFDINNSVYGIQQWNGASATTTGGQKFSYQLPVILGDSEIAKIDPLTNKPLASVGAIGQYCVVALTVGTGAGDFDATKETIKVYYKNYNNEWVLVGSPEWKASHPAVFSSAVVPAFTAATAGNLVINGTTVIVSDGDTVSDVKDSIDGLSIAGISTRVVNNRLYLYTDGTNNSFGDSTLENAVVVSGDTVVLNNLKIEAKTYYGPALQMSPHTQVPLFKLTDEQPRPTGSVWIKTTEPNAGARWRISRYSRSLGSWEQKSAPLYASGHAAIYFLDRAGGGLNLPINTLFVQYNADEDTGNDTTPSTAVFRVWKRSTTGRTIIKSKVIAENTVTTGACDFTIQEFVKGELSLSAATPVNFTATGTADDAQAIAAAINGLGLQYVEADVTANNELLIIHTTGGDIRLKDGTGTPLSDLFAPFDIDAKTGTVNYYVAPVGAQTTSVGYPGTADAFIASNWRPLAADDFVAADEQPLEEPVDGQLWFNLSFSDVDILVHNGETWVGYQFPGDINTPASPYYTTVEDEKTDPEGPIVAASEPETQSDGTALANGDLWISTADLENFPTIYRWNGLTLEWELLDKTDQTTEDGILFADARYGLAGETGNTEASIVDLLSSRYLDPDAPDPDLSPKGMLLWNTRRSSGNVKRYRNNYINTALDNDRFLVQTEPGVFSGESMTNYATDRWVTASPNNEDGSGTFGRKAQRAVIIAALKSVVDTSEEIRDEERRNFNLIACPGYPELLSNLVNLNIERGLTAFVIGDTPLRLKSDATSLTTWGTNANNVTDNGDNGLVTFNEYAAIYYPNGFTTDLGGANVVVPASHMMLRTIALSDQVSYPWFAPAGTRRGGITNATSVGYINAADGEFRTVALNNGQRDTLYELKINPIPFFVGVGHVAYGQKTLARNASALDRINVARLVVYLRSQLNKLARPYIFEPNDKITRDEVKGAVESLLLELVGLRELYDFAVVCDESNNTPARIDRNELWIDIAIEPVKAIEFIYIPLRIKNTGEI